MNHLLGAVLGAAAAVVVAGCGAQDGLGAAGDATAQPPSPTIAASAATTGETGTADDVAQAGIPCPPTESTKAAVTDGLPDTALPCLGPGPDVVLSALPPKPAVVNVWATWCAPCRTEMPLLADLAVAAQDSLTVLGIDVLDDRAAATAFAADVGIASVFDPTGSTRSSLGWTGPPVTYLVAADGRIVHRIYGQIPDSQSLRADVAQYLGVEVGDG